MIRKNRVTMIQFQPQRLEKTVASLFFFRGKTNEREWSSTLRCTEISYINYSLSATSVYDYNARFTRDDNATVPKKLATSKRASNIGLVGKPNQNRITHETWNRQSV